MYARGIARARARIPPFLPLRPSLPYLTINLIARKMRREQIKTNRPRALRLLTAINCI